MTRNLRDGGRTAQSIETIERLQLYLGLGYSAERAAEIVGADEYLARYLKQTGAWTPRYRIREAA